MNRKLTIYYPHLEDERTMYHYVHQFEQETKFAPEPSLEFIGLLFNLGSSEIKIQLPKSQHILARNQFTILYLPQGCCEVTYAAGKHNFFVTQFEISYLEKIAEVFPILDGLLEKVEKKIPTVVNAGHLLITPKTRGKINDVIHNQYTGQFRKMYLHVKFEDIIIQSLADRKKDGVPGLNDLEIDKIKKAYARIANNVKSHDTISMIADEIGLDKRKLEKGFLLLYKTTVHRFIIDERLKIAVGLLRDTTRSINEIAKSVGYTSRKTFTKLFKRKYGYPPSTLREGNED
jgi:AraC-like DNA-binding protein